MIGGSTLLRICLLLLLSLFWALPASVPGQEHPGAGVIRVGDLPAEARQTLALIRKGGPFPYRKDGTVFGNFEGRLPARPRGYYREYTVSTPGLPSRGARRIVAAGSGTADVRSGRPAEYYYTKDHYRSFLRIKE